MSGFEVVFDGSRTPESKREQTSCSEGRVAPGCRASSDAPQPDDGYSGPAACDEVFGDD